MYVVLLLAVIILTWTNMEVRWQCHGGGHVDRLVNRTSDFNTWNCHFLTTSQHWLFTTTTTMFSGPEARCIKKNHKSDFIFSEMTVTSLCCCSRQIIRCFYASFQREYTNDIFGRVILRTCHLMCLHVRHSAWNETSCFVPKDLLRIVTLCAFDSHGNQNISYSIYAKLLQETISGIWEISLWFLWKRFIWG